MCASRAGRSWVRPTSLRTSTSPLVGSHFLLVLATTCSFFFLACGDAVMLLDPLNFFRERRRGCVVTGDSVAKVGEARAILSHVTAIQAATSVCFLASPKAASLCPLPFFFLFPRDGRQFLPPWGRACGRF